VAAKTTAPVAPVRGDIAEKVAEALRSAQEKAGISRSELARRAGKRPGYVTNLMRGQVNPTVLTVAQLAHAMDCELWILLAPRRAG